MTRLKRVFCPPLCWLREHPLFVLFCLVVFVVGATAGAVQHGQRGLAREQRARVEALAREQAARQHEQCLASVQGRQVLRELVMVSTSGAQFDLTALPAYKQLDPASQEYFRELRDLQRSSTGPSAQLRQELLDKVPIPTC